MITSCPAIAFSIRADNWALASEILVISIPLTSSYIV
jgi:hypothetical protein